MAVRDPSLSSRDVVLVVEDEAAVRIVLLHGAAARSAIAVLEAPGPVEALDALQARDRQLVLTDITMPGMNGKEMVKRIDRGQQPDLKVLYMSGYSENIEPGSRSAREAVYVGRSAEARRAPRSIVDAFVAPSVPDR